MRDDVTIYCIRHGETDWNAEARYQGNSDTQLNDKGRKQAARNGDALRSFLPEIIRAEFVASPMSRAVETMQIIRMQLGLAPNEFTLDDRLREVNYGHWEGKLASELPQIDPAGVAARRADPYNWCPDGGESYAGLMLRVVDWMSEVERDTVIATHGGISRSLRGELIGADMDGVLRLVAPQDRVLVIKRGEMRWF